MGRRRKITVRKNSARRAPKKKVRSPRKMMLNMRNLSSFRYHLKMTLDGVEGGGPLYANIFSKSSNIGIDEAKQYVQTVVDEGKLSRDKASEIFDLLRKFSKFR